MEFSYQEQIGNTGWADGAPVRRSYRGPWPRRLRAGRVHRVRPQYADTAQLATERTAAAALYARARFGTAPEVPRVRRAREGGCVDQLEQ